jgi:purine-binding chemotaxis protein CheW
VNQPITLVPEDVKWRSDRSKRPWLAGTVKDHMCALLDIPRIGQLLIEADKNFVSA